MVNVSIQFLFEDGATNCFLDFLELLLIFDRHTVIQKVRAFDKDQYKDTCIYREILENICFRFEAPDFMGQYLYNVQCNVEFFFEFVYL